MITESFLGLGVVFGVLLQIGSGISFLMAFQMPFARIPFANSFFIVSLHNLDGPGNMHLFAGTGALAWVIAFCVQYRLLFSCEKIWPQKALPLLHRFTLWILIFNLTRESALFVDLLLPIFTMK